MWLSAGSFAGGFIDTVDLVPPEIIAYGDSASLELAVDAVVVWTDLACISPSGKVLTRSRSPEGLAASAKLTLLDISCLIVAFCAFCIATICCMRRFTCGLVVAAGVALFDFVMVPDFFWSAFVSSSLGSISVCHETVFFMVAFLMMSE